MFLMFGKLNEFKGLDICILISEASVRVESERREGFAIKRKQCCFDCGDWHLYSQDLTVLRKL